MSIAQTTNPGRIHPVMLRIADRLDQIILVGLFIWFCTRVMPNGFPPAGWYQSMLVVSEAIIVFFVLARRPTDRISLNPMDWTIALAGTMAPMLVVASGETFLPGVGFVIILVGTVTHLFAKLSLRRSFGIVPADRGIKSGGLYAFVRHPMYTGYIIGHFGFIIAAPNLWNVAVYACGWALLVARVYREEALLSQNPEYAEYMTKVRHRLIPGVF